MNRTWDEILPIEAAILDLGLQMAREGRGAFYAYGMACDLERARWTPALSSNGTMYKALRRMEAHGWLKSSYEDAAAAEADGKRPRRTLYEVTADGEQAFLQFEVKGARAEQKAGARVGKKAGVRVRKVAGANGAVP